MRGRWIGCLAGVVIAFSAVSLAAPQGTEAPGGSGAPIASAGTGVSFRPPSGALIAPGTAADLTLLYTGDVVGYVDPCG